MSKCAFGHPKIEFLGRSIISKNVGPIEDKIEKLLEITKFPTVHWLRTVLQAVHTESSRNTCAPV